MNPRRMMFLVFPAVGVVLTVLWFFLLGGGPDPLEVVSAEPQDVIVSLERPVDLLVGARDFLISAGVKEAEPLRNVPPAWLLSLAGVNGTAALGVDFRPGGERASFLLAVKGGRLLQLASLPFAGERPLALPNGMRLFRLRSTFVLQGGGARPVGTGAEPGFLPGGQVRIFARPRKIAGTLGMSEELGKILDALRLPWPVEAFSAGAGLRGGRLAADFSGRFVAGDAGPLVSRVFRETPEEPLAARFAEPGRTMLAVSWFAPGGEDVAAALSDLAPPGPVAAGGFRTALGRFLSGGFAGGCGKRAALLVNFQDNRVKPGYPGVGFVQELRAGNRVKEALEEFIAGTGIPVVPEGEGAAAFPYFERRKAAGRLPERFVLFSEMMRPSEGYEPLVAVGGGFLFYASSEKMLSMMLSARGFGNVGRCHGWLTYRNQGKESLEQLRRFADYLLEEALSSRATGRALSDGTDYRLILDRVEGVLSSIRELDAGMSFGSPGVFEGFLRITPGKASP